jgi:glutamate-1-semialdehyde 2,1-aminomutase
MAAGLATLNLLKQGDVYKELEMRGNMLFSGLEIAARAAGVSIVVNHIGSMGSLFFTAEPVTDFERAKASDTTMFKRYYTSMLQSGIYLAPSPYEATFLSTAHSEEIIEKTIECATVALRSLDAKIN